MSPVEEVLRLVAAAAPEPWHPRRFVAGGGVDEEVLNAALDELWLERLIVRAPGDGRDDPGVTLTPLGDRVLREPEALQRLRQGRPLFADDPGAVFRHSLRHPRRPVFSRLLLWANVAVFAYGAYLAYGVPQLLQVYLVGFPTNLGVALRLQETLHTLGSVSGSDLLAGQWWRLLTSCFVHAGLLHLGLNMFALRSIGAFVEQTW